MAKKPQHFLGIDIGASSGRGVLGHMENDQIKIKEINRFHNGPIRMGDMIFWDFPRLWDSVVETLRAAGDKTQGKLAGIGVNTWGVDFGLLGRDGHLVNNPICHRDPIAAHGLKRVLGAFSKEDFFKRIGHTPAHVASLSQLAGMADTALADKLKITDAFLMIPDIMRYYLCGQKAVEYTAAGSTQMADISTGKWSHKVLRELGIPTRILPQIVYPGTVAGNLHDYLAKSVGLGKTPVYVAPGHDTAAGAAAVPFRDEKTAFIIIGTWSIMGTTMDKGVRDPEASQYGFLNEFGYDSIIFVRNMLGMYLFEMLYRNLNRKKKTTYAEMVKAAKEAPAFKYFINGQAEEFMLTEDPAEEVAGFLKKSGQKSPKNTGSLIRTILEGMVWNWRSMLGHMARFSGREFERICLVGGGIRNQLLCQMVADATDMEVIAGPAEATIMGNIVGQMAGAGTIPKGVSIDNFVRNSVKLKRYRPKGAKQWDMHEDQWSRVSK